MVESLLLQERQDGSLRWLDLSALNKTVRSGSLAEFAGQYQGQTVTLVWPAEDALLIEIELPLRKAAQITKALAFALEDHLAEDVERYHLVWQRIPRSSRIAVVAVAHDLLLACKQRFAAVGVVLSRVLPEALLLPWHEGHGALLISEKRCVFRLGACTGGGGELYFANLVREKYTLNIGTGIDLRLYVDDTAVAAETSSPEEDNHQSALVSQEMAAIGDEDHPVNSVVPLVLYAQQCESAANLNLLSGVYAVKPQMQGKIKLWWPAAAILLLALSMQLFAQWHVVTQQRQQLVALQEENAALFRQTFPHIKRLVNLKVQANQALQDIEQQIQQPSRFLSLLYRVGELLKQQTQLSLQGLQFIDDALRFKVSGPDKASLDVLINRLAAETDLHTQDQAFSTVKNGVEVEFVVRQN